VPLELLAFAFALALLRPWLRPASRSDRHRGRQWQRQWKRQWQWKKRQQKQRIRMAEPLTIEKVQSTAHRNHHPQQYTRRCFV
jgi:hypothetical protein